VRGKCREDVVGAEVGREERREQAPCRQARTGKDKRLGKAQKPGGDNGRIHGIKMPEPRHAIQSAPGGRRPRGSVQC